MEIITGTTDFIIEEETAVAIGKFDGVHVGHRRLLQEILDEKRNGRRACVFTFDPPPAVLFHGKGEKELSTREEKRRIFEFLGVDILIEFPLTLETAAIPPETFARDVLFGQMGAVVVAAGTDLSFGNKGAGDAALLSKIAMEYGAEVKIIDKVFYEDREVSSTLVREAVDKGDMPYARKLLGEPYSVQGRVEHGNHIGHSLGMPTVNLVPPADKLLPPNGVYYSKVRLGEQIYNGISNIGLKPTVQEAEKHLNVETYLYDFEGDAYGAEIAVSLYEFRRPEKKFADFEELKKQLKEDMEAGETYWK